MDHFKINESEQSEKTSSKKVFSEAFVDKLNDDFGDAHEIHDIPDAIVEEFKDEPIEDHSIESVFVDKLSDASNLNELFGDSCNTGIDINMRKELQNNVSFKGLFINDKSWHLKEAQLAKEQADWHRKEADKAMKNGDVSSARDHASKAKEYDKKYNEHIQDASKCTK